MLPMTPREGSNDPTFLMLSEDQWPRSERIAEFEDGELEVKALVLTTSATPGVSMVACEKYSSWMKLVRLYAWWMRYKFRSTRENVVCQ